MQMSNQGQPTGPQFSFQQPQQQQFQQGQSQQSQPLGTHSVPAQFRAQGQQGQQGQQAPAQQWGQQGPAQQWGQQGQFGGQQQGPPQQWGQQSQFQQPMGGQQPGFGKGGKGGQGSQFRGMEGGKGSMGPSAGKGGQFGPGGKGKMGGPMGKGQMGGKGHPSSRRGITERKITDMKHANSVKEMKKMRDPRKGPVHASHLVTQRATKPTPEEEPATDKRGFCNSRDGAVRGNSVKYDGDYVAGCTGYTSNRPCGCGVQSCGGGCRWSGSFCNDCQTQGCNGGCSLINSYESVSSFNKCSCSQPCIGQCSGYLGSAQAFGYNGYGEGYNPYSCSCSGRGCDSCWGGGWGGGGGWGSGCGCGSSSCGGQCGYGGGGGGGACGCGTSGCYGNCGWAGGSGSCGCGNTGCFGECVQTPCGPLVIPPCVRCGVVGECPCGSPFIFGDFVGNSIYRTKKRVQCDVSKPREDMTLGDTIVIANPGGLDSESRALRPEKKLKIYHVK